MTIIKNLSLKEAWPYMLKGAKLILPHWNDSSYLAWTSNKPILHIENQPTEWWPSVEDLFSTEWVVTISTLELGPLLNYYSKRSDDTSVATVNLLKKMQARILYLEQGLQSIAFNDPDYLASCKLCGKPWLDCHDVESPRHEIATGVTVTYAYQKAAPHEFAKKILKDEPL